MLSVVCGFLGWRKFRDLEVIDGEIGVFSQSRSTTSATAAAQKIQLHSATLQLFKKDLMLLRMPVGLSVAGMFLIIFLNKDQAALWTLVYPAIVVLLIAAVASADERQLGVAEWQTLMPVAFYKQWMIKFFATWSTAVVVGLALPITALFYKTGELEKIGGTDFFQVAPVFIAASFGFVALTLYVSSICNSGLKALIAAILVNVCAAYIAIQMFDAYSTFIRRLGIFSRDLWAEPMVVRPALPKNIHDAYYTSTAWWLHTEYIPFLLSLLGLVVIALILSMRNHRYAERGSGRLLRQIAAFAGYEAIAAIAVTMFWNWYSWLR
jgi:hypothetical protein